MDINEFNEFLETYYADCRISDAKEEARLISIIQSGQEGAKLAEEKIVRANMYWAGVYARKFQFAHMDIQDLWQSANIGLYQSINSFDASKGVPFHIYAEFRMKSCILESISKEGHLISLPQNIQTDLERLRKITNKLTTKEGKPSVEEIAKGMNVEEGYVYYLQSVKPIYTDIEGNKDNDDDSDDDEKPTANDPVCIYEPSPKRVRLQDSLKYILPPLDYEIYIRSEGLEGYKPMTHKEIVEDINRIRTKKGKIGLEDVQIHYNRAVILANC